MFLISSMVAALVVGFNAQEPVDCTQNAINNYYECVKQVEATYNACINNNGWGSPIGKCLERASDNYIKCLRTFPEDFCQEQLKSDTINCNNIELGRLGNCILNREEGLRLCEDALIDELNRCLLGQ